MAKVELTASIVASIIVGIIKNGDKEIFINGGTKRLLEMCGLDESNTIGNDDRSFYVRKHRIKSSGDYIQQFKRSLDRSWCLIDLIKNDRVFNANMDFAAVQCNLTFLVHTDQMEYLDMLLDRANLKSYGERYVIPENTLFDVDGKACSRSATVSFTPIQVVEIKTASAFGESAIMTCSVAMNITENLAIDSDCSLSLSLKMKDTDIAPTLFSNVAKLTMDCACTSNTRPLMQPSLNTLGIIETGKISVISFSSYVPINDLGKALERLVAAYRTQTRAVLNEIIVVSIKLPNGTIITQEMICTEAKFSSSLTDPCIISVILNPKAIIGGKI